MAAHRISVTTDQVLRKYIEEHEHDREAFMKEKSILSYYKLGLENKKAYEKGMSFDEAIRFLLNQLGEDISTERIRRPRGKK